MFDQSNDDNNSLKFLDNTCGPTGKVSFAKSKETFEETSREGGIR